MRIATSLTSTSPRREAVTTMAERQPPGSTRRGHSDSGTAPGPTVVEVLRMEALPVGSRGSRRVVVRWSDGFEGEALRWYADEIHIGEAELIGKTRAQLRSLHVRRDRARLRSSVRV
jgi:hypothetical protein